MAAFGTQKSLERQVGFTGEAGGDGYEDDDDYYSGDDYGDDDYGNEPHLLQSDEDDEY